MSFTQPWSCQYSNCSPKTQRLWQFWRVGRLSWATQSEWFPGLDKHFWNAQKHLYMTSSQQLQMNATQSTAPTKTQKLSTGRLSDVVEESWQDELLQSGPRCFNSYLFLFSIQRSFCFKWTALRGTGTKVCPWRHGPNSRESWQLLGIDGTLMDIKPHNGWIGKQKGVKEWWRKENVHSQRGTKREVCEWEMGESQSVWGEERGWGRRAWRELSVSESKSFVSRLLVGAVCSVNSIKRWIIPPETLR